MPNYATIKMKREAHKTVSYWISKVNLNVGNSNGEQSLSENDPLVFDPESEKKSRCCCLEMDGPDSAWSWVIALANFLINFIMNGLKRMSGILYIMFMNHFKIDREMASLPFSVQTAVRNLFGPFTGVLGHKCGLRFITILGGLIGCGSAVLLFFELTVPTTVMSLGLLFGLGIALTTTLTQLSINQHFEKNRATAGGFALAGGCVGGLVLPLLLEPLLQHYGIRGTFLILTGFILLVVPAGMMLAPPSWTKPQLHRPPPRYGTFSVDKLKLSNEWEKQAAQAGQAKTSPQPTGSGHQQRQKSFVDFRLLRENEDVVFDFLTSEAHYRIFGLNPRQDAFPTFDKATLMNEVENIYKSVQLRTPVVSQDAGEQSAASSCAYVEACRAYIRKRLKNVTQYQGVDLVASIPHWDQSRAWDVLTELRKLYEIIGDQAFFLQLSASTKLPLAYSPEQVARANTLCGQLKLAVVLHANPVFLLICLSRALYNMTLTPVLTIIVDFAMDMGIPFSDGKYVVSALSAGEVIGRMFFGWITDRACVTLPRCMVVGMVALGACTAALPLMANRAAFFADVFLFGLLQGLLFIRHPVLVSKYLMPHEVAVGIGTIHLMSGLLSLGIPSMIGYFRDHLGSYNKMFYYSGIASAIIGLAWFLEPLLVSSCAANHNDRRNVEPPELSREQP